MVGAALGSVAGSASILLYVVAGGLGAPIYASHSAGWSVLTSPSGGYLVGFVAAAALTGALAQLQWDRRFSSSLAALVCGNVVIYLFGVVWLSYDLGLNLNTSLEKGLYPFVVGDVLKLYLAAAALPTAWRIVGGDQ